MRRIRSYVSRHGGHTLAAPSGPSTNYSLEQLIFANNVPRIQNEREHFSRFLTLDTIDQAYQRSAQGAMVQITDLGRETLSLDGHMTGLVQKRFNRVAAMEWLVKADDGGGVDEFDRGRAEDRADFARRQIMRIPNFKGRLKDLNWGIWDNRALLEIDWEVVPGREVGDSKLPLAWRVRDLCWTHPRRLSYTQNRDLAVIDQEQGYNFRPVGFLPSRVPEKFINFTPRLFGDYAEREGLLPRSLYWSFFQRLGTKERIQLMEIFAAPWRYAYSEGPHAPNVDAAKAAFDLLQRMSSRAAAWLPHGVKAQFVKPDSGSGQIHKEVIDDARMVLSKMILGNTGTTDAVSTGLGSSIGDAHLSEEDLIIAADLFMLADVIEHQLTDRIIAMNYGLEELKYAPVFGFHIEAITDRGKEIENIKGAAEAGLRIPLEQAYQRAGYRMPRNDEPYIAWVEPPPIMGMPAGAPRCMIVWPEGKAPPPGELAIQPEEALGLIEEPTSTPPALPPAAPPAAPEAKPAPAPATPPAGQNPEAPPEEQPPVAKASMDDDDEPEITMPFQSPSGLTDAERDTDE